MSLETASTIAQLQSSAPSASDPVNQGDDHIRMIKHVLKNIFPGSGGQGFSIPIVATEAEINFLDGVTSNIQAQLGLISTKAASGANTDITSLNAPALGAATATTQVITDDSTKVATTAFVQDIADLLCPPGTILPFAGSTVPAGFLEVPTTATNVSRTTYARLFAAIGTLWGAGDGSTTFGLPWIPSDYTLLQAGVGAVGSATVGEVIAHTHTQYGHSNYAGFNEPGSVPRIGITDTGSTGGPFNKAAGRRVKYMVKY